ncbi:uncharacterized protein GGS22DRAFT_168327 [Annulohypoxylon maeteangense]|uniref:uncharacterized protein n=1 Tax=Annulohypoxylon maeteangense TaxID=1927788 RepID=UPI002008D3E9|nr:uncharacterized protein GGS22DRAFT_168327 [Annulohypoxylon maeteangense]KAI0883280.1 hypothetical protein GGS22DRAFT_168327 [Annulohypoxylon maeteangense]
MLTSLLTTTITLLSLAGATPVPQTAQQLSRAKAYQLQIQLLDPTKDLDPSVAGSFIGTVHVGAGQNVAVAGSHNASGTPFYTNGTVADGYVDVLNDLGTQYPWGFKVQDRDSSDATYPGEHDVEIDVGGGTNGVSLVTNAEDVRLGGLSAGYYAVCDRFIGYVRGNLTVVKYVYEGETLPEGCVGIKFVPLCAELNTLPEGSEWTHDFVQEVDCVVPS